MKYSRILLFSLLLSGILVSQESANTTTARQEFAPGGEIRMHLSPGGYEIVGSDSNLILVTYSTNTFEQLKRVKVQIKTTRADAELWIRDAPHNNFHATIEVPYRSDLWVRLSAGDLNIDVIRADDFTYEMLSPKTESDQTTPALTPATATDPCGRVERERACGPYGFPTTRGFPTNPVIAG